MQKEESIQEMHTRITTITNELCYLVEVIPTHKRVRKFLGVLPKRWESKVDAITEARDLNKMALDELNDNLNNYEMLKKLEKLKNEPKD